MSPRIAVVSFPGSNCEYDATEALRDLGAEAEIVWHAATDLAGFDAVVIPGGFAHGDYLRCGAIARFSPVMEAVRLRAEAGDPVLGICNGFQVLCEAGLLPGALVRNAGLRFICAAAEVEVVSTASVLTAGSAVGDRLVLPINHGEGCYVCAPEELARIEARGQVVLRYAANPNGSVHAIAGVANERGNVVGLMPHPERAQKALFGSADGRGLLAAFVARAVPAASR